MRRASIHSDLRWAIVLLVTTAAITVAASSFYLSWRSAGRPLHDLRDPFLSDRFQTGSIAGLDRVA
jgi:hypothetical protein